ncbi:hypothetical protein HPP92_005371 [Vanilla planifolia]|uniref:Uncharacterized protein n=1 Tax=Vanilla planifolia TaxID=51239 RepID=A0A835RTQ8_VANPL|nr:hypothetical protein HPP92_005371 [Vanilla planifolia]
MASSSHSSNPLQRFLSSRRMDNGPFVLPPAFPKPLILPLASSFPSLLPHSPSTKQEEIHSRPGHFWHRRFRLPIISLRPLGHVDPLRHRFLRHMVIFCVLHASLQLGRSKDFGVGGQQRRVDLSRFSGILYRIKFLLPLAVPLLLFNADLRRIMKSTGTLLLAFLIGSVATTIGTLVAYLIVPMRSLGQDSWKIAAALMSRHIGGAIYRHNGLHHPMRTCYKMDTKIGTSYLMIINKLTIYPFCKSAMAVTVSFTICKLGTYITNVIGLQGGKLPCITAIIVVLATMFPTQFGALAPSGEAIALLLMQVFFAVVGANGSVRNVINTTPAIFAYSTIQIAVHVAVILGLGKLFGFEKKILLIASNANVGGPTTACGMATAKGWNSLIIPGILAGVMGLAIATFICIGFGLFVLKHM